MHDDLSANRWRLAWPVGRVLLASLFLISGLLKFAFHGPIAGVIASKGLPLPDLTAWMVALFEVGAAVVLIWGRWLVPTALALAGWCVLTAVLFHPFWAATGLEQQSQLANFLKNISLVGAFLIVAADAYVRSASAPDTHQSPAR